MYTTSPLEHFGATTMDTATRIDKTWDAMNDEERTKHLVHLIDTRTPKPGIEYLLDKPIEDIAAFVNTNMSAYSERFAVLPSPRSKQKRKNAFRLPGITQPLRGSDLRHQAQRFIKRRNSTK